MNKVNQKRCFTKSVFAWLLCLSMLLQVLCACKSDPANGETTSQSETGGAIQRYYSGYLDEYRIVRTTALISSDGVYAGKVFAEALSVASGKEFSSVLDTKIKDDGGKEILLGVTNRQESVDAIEALEKNEFSINVVGNKIVIVGENGIALDKAIKYFLANYLYETESVSEIHPYRAKDPDGVIELTEMSEYAYGDSVCTYAGCIQQDFAIDFATGDVYYSMADQFCDSDSVIVRRMPNGHQEYMILTKFGHMETFDIERVGDKVYLWVCSEAADHSASSAAISRFEFQAGTRCEWNYGETFELGTPHHNPSIDIANGYVTNWTNNEVSIYDIDRFLAGDKTHISTVNISFPFYQEHRVTRAIAGGYDLCGSYIYSCWYAEKGSASQTDLYLIAHDLNGNVVGWTTIEYEPEGSNIYREINGIKAEIVNGVPRVFICLSTESAINSRYQSTIVVFSERKLEVVPPMVESKAQLSRVTFDALPQNAISTRWKANNGVLSLKAYGEERLMFDEAAFKGEHYTYESVLTLNGAKYAGMMLAGAANVSNNLDLYNRNRYIGLKISVSNGGKLNIIADTINATYDISAQSTYTLKADVTETGELCVWVNGSLIAELQLTNKYIGGHVGLFAQDGSASFSNTILTYHHS